MAFNIIDASANIVSGVFALPLNNPFGAGFRASKAASVLLSDSILTFNEKTSCHWNR
jgi:hypothetical protein